MQRFFIICIMSCMLLSCSKGDDIGNNNQNKPEVVLDKITLEENEIKADPYYEPVTVKFNSTGSWKSVVTTYNNENWIKVEPKSGQAGNSEVTITIATNCSYDDRKGKVTIYTDTASQSIEVEQESITNALVPLDETYRSTDFSKDGEIHSMQQATEGNGINVVFMGDGFADSRFADGTYHKTMMYAMEMFFRLEPYKSFRHLFNCDYINVISEHEKVGTGETALQTQFGEGTIVTGNDGIILEHALYVVGEDRMDNTVVAVIVNAQTRAGTCTWFLPEKQNDYGCGFTIGCNTIWDLWNLIPHECAGHGFAKLSDEYVNYNGPIPEENKEGLTAGNRLWGWYKNTDSTNDPNSIKWSHFLADSRYANEVGIFEGAAYFQYGVYRPSENSMMNASRDEDVFNAPSREAIYYRIHKLAYGEEWEYDYEKFVEWDAINRGQTRTRSQRSEYVTKPAEHQSPIIVNKSWREVINK